MSLTEREIWTAFHGVLGTLFLVAFAGGLAGFWGLKGHLITEKGIAERTRRLALGTTLMAIIVWLTVLTGMLIILPWYKEMPPAGTIDLTGFPKALLLADPTKAGWHTFAAEWKEHIIWIVPFVATSVAFTVLYYGKQLVLHKAVRRMLLILFILNFMLVGLAATFGALITKAAPVQ